MDVHVPGGLGAFPVNSPPHPTPLAGYGGTPSPPPPVSQVGWGSFARAIGFEILCGAFLGGNHTPS